MSETNLKITRLGIIGGTFDPIHYGHLVAAECAREVFDLKKMIFMPSARPPHKDLDKVLDSTHRYQMVKRAVADHPLFEVSDLELKRSGLSYTVDTIDYFLKQIPGVQIYFIMGVDALQMIDTWKEVNRLVGLCEFVVVSRPGYTFNPDDDCFKEVSPVLWQHLHTLEIPGMYISSTEIRQRVKDGKSIRYLLPNTVDEYILENNLYRGELENDE